MFYIREWIARGADCSPISADVKRSNSLVRISLLFFRLILFGKFQTHSSSSREKQFILDLDVSTSPQGHHLNQWDKRTSQSDGFWMTRGKHPVEGLAPSEGRDPRGIIITRCATRESNPWLTAGYWRELTQVSFLSRQEFIATKHVFFVVVFFSFCRDKRRFFFPDKQVFVATKICLSRQKYACRDNIIGGCCHKYHFCRERSFVATNTCL